MKLAAFNAVCTYEIGDRVVILEVAGKNENGGNVYAAGRGNNRYCLYALHKVGKSNFHI
ncbi:hypothetical protein AALB52_01400 [Lachnospiraceae bacterium 38-14]